MKDTELLGKFLSHLRVERGLSTSTQSAYRWQIDGYLRVLSQQGLSLSDATKNSVLAYVESRQRSGIKPSSIFHLVLTLRLFHRFLFSEKLMESDPTVTL